MSAFSAPGGLPGMQQRVIQTPAPPSMTGEQTLAKMAADIAALKARLAPTRLLQDIKNVNLTIGTGKQIPINTGTTVNGFLCTIKAGTLDVYFNASDTSAGVPDLTFSAPNGTVYIPIAEIQLTSIYVFSSDVSSGATFCLKLLSY